MKAKQFFEMTNDELVAKLNELKSELFFLRFKNATNQLSNPNVLNTTKKDIARIKTILRERELNISSEPSKAAKKTKATK
ncbi:MAG: 50S ribosomal protein L29 [Clostridia bacterium]|nr:50S ribosomal protein L29 [Clostridia bacterium]MDY5263748.1 50S ribosomal protein L29 [Eubacteriales bacterium]MDY5439180.1 50S ribosomal protein L29 [Eubacteriales bacterium]